MRRNQNLTPNYSKNTLNMFKNDMDEITYVSSEIDKLIDLIIKSNGKVMSVDKKGIEKLKNLKLEVGKFGIKYNNLYKVYNNLYYKELKL